MHLINWVLTEITPRPALKKIRITGWNRIFLQNLAILCGFGAMVCWKKYPPVCGGQNYIYLPSVDKIRADKIRDRAQNAANMARKKASDTWMESAKKNAFQQDIVCHCSCHGCWVLSSVPNFVRCANGTLELIRNNFSGKNSCFRYRPASKTVYR